MKTRVITPVKLRIVPNFRITEAQKQAIKDNARKFGFYVQEYTDFVFNNLELVNKALESDPNTDI